MDMPPEMPPLPDKPVAEALMECGVRPDGFTITYDDLLQGHVIAFSATSGASADNLDCIWQATRSEFVEFADAELQRAYEAIGAAYYEAHLRPQVIESARERLAERGLLQTLPLREDFQSQEGFAAALEMHCGFVPSSVLRVEGNAFTVWPQSDGTPSAEFEFEKFSCLLSALTLATEADGGLKIGFVGNEKFRGPEGE